MGVKQGASQLTGDIKEEFDKILKERPKYRKTTSMAIQLQSLGHFRRIDAIVLEFFSRVSYNLTQPPPFLLFLIAYILF